MSQVQPKLCKDCAFFVNFAMPEFKDHPELAEAFCKRTFISGKDLVFGGSAFAATPCSIERIRECGPEAKFFKPKP